MELTIEEALQQAVAAHKEGKLQGAERLYRAILESHPLHPDANHNLGILLASLNKTDAALPLFKTALEANPKIEQFWLSYIHVLIKEKQFDNAKKALGQAKKHNMEGDKLNALKAQLASINKPENITSAGPSQQQLSSLLDHYQNGRLDDAEKLAISLTHKFSQHQFAWKVLGVILGQKGRHTEALVASQKSVQIEPQDAEAHSNMGITLQELGRFNEAKVAYKQAIALKPDFTEAHYNLGNTQQQLGRLDEAKESYTQAIALKPDYAEAHYNLSITLKELGRLNEAEAGYKQAIALKPDYAEAHTNLASMLQELGRFEEAEASYTQAMALNPDYPEIHYNLGVMLQEIGRLEEAEPYFLQAIAYQPDFTKAHNSLLKCLYLLDKKSLFIDQLDFLINQDKANAVIGSLTCRSALKYGLEKPNIFCNEPLKYVLHTDMNTQYDFEEIFVKNSKYILNDNRLSNRKQPLLHNGYQTSGNLFDIKTDLTEKIHTAIRIEIEKYRINFKNSHEGLIKKWPTDYSLYGWLISMSSGGEIKPHIHDYGWLSGSIYINVPSKSMANSGNLVVSLGEKNDATDARLNMEKIINVVTGSLVLFPASLTHYTIPFESEEERIVLAFDVIAK